MAQVQEFEKSLSSCLHFFERFLTRLAGVALVNDCIQIDNTQFERRRLKSRTQHNARESRRNHPSRPGQFFAFHLALFGGNLSRGIRDVISGKGCDILIKDDAEAVSFSDLHNRGLVGILE